MAFSYTNEKGSTYYLHSLKTELKNGNKRLIYFFAREINKGKGTALDEVPEGYQVAETRNGLPVLKKA